MWLERLGWVVALAGLGALPVLWLALKVISWRDRRRGLVDDDWSQPLTQPPHVSRVDYRRF